MHLLNEKHEFTPFEQVDFLDNKKISPCAELHPDDTTSLIADGAAPLGGTKPVRLTGKDACPCGSKKSYKRCCKSADKKRARATKLGLNPSELHSKRKQAEEDDSDVSAVTKQMQHIRV